MFRRRRNELFDEAVGLAPRECGQLDRVSRKAFGKRYAVLGEGVARDADEEDLRAWLDACHVREQIDERRRCPVKVVEDQDVRLLACDFLAEAPEGPAQLACPRRRLVRREGSC